jgi:hypothetical protein
VWVLWGFLVGGVFRVGVWSGFSVRFLWVVGVWWGGKLGFGWGRFLFVVWFVVLVGWLVVGGLGLSRGSCAVCLRGWGVSSTSTHWLRVGVGFGGVIYVFVGVLWGWLVHTGVIPSLSPLRLVGGSTRVGVSLARGSLLVSRMVCRQPGGSVRRFGCGSRGWLSVAYLQ